MKKKKLAVFALLTAFALSLFGCRDRHILDGPGMVNDQPWRGFTLTRTDSFSQYNFWFTVQQGDFAFLLTGQCRDAEGELYTEEEGIELSAEDLQYLRELWLGDLPDATSDTGDDAAFPLDAPEVNLVLTWMDGSEQEKVLPQEISIEIYERFLHYFINY